MTKFELINALLDMPGDPDVYLHADHGQSYEDATSVSLLDGDDSEYYIEVDGPSIVIYGL